MAIILSKHEKLVNFYKAIKEHKRKSVLCFLLTQQAKIALGKKAEKLRLVEVYKDEQGVWFYKITTQLEEKPTLISEEEYIAYSKIVKDYIEGML